MSIATAQSELTLRCPYCFCGKDEGEACNQCDHTASTPRPPLALTLGYKLVGRYQIGSVRTGHDITGFTYNAFDLEDNLPVVIKEYLPRNLAGRNLRSGVVVAHQEKESLFNFGRAKFIEELKAIQSYDYTFFATAGQIIETNGSVYAVLDQYPNHNLVDHLENNQGSLDIVSALALIEKIAAHLSVLHKHGRLHSDLRPENIYIDGNGDPIVADFGYAKYALAERTLSLFHTVAPGFAPPEQYYSQSKVTVASDVYSLAAVLYFLLAGLAPPEAIERTHFDIMPKPSSSIPGLSPQFDQILLHALAISPQQRPQSISEFVSEMMMISESVHFVFGDASVPSYQALVAVDSDSANIGVLQWIMRIFVVVAVIGIAAAAGYLFHDVKSGDIKSTDDVIDRVLPLVAVEAGTPDSGTGENNSVPPASVAVNEVSTRQPVATATVAQGQIVRESDAAEDAPSLESDASDTVAKPSTRTSSRSVALNLLSAALKQIEVKNYAADESSAWSLIRSSELLGAPADAIEEVKKTLVHSLSGEFLRSLDNQNKKQADSLLDQAKNIPLLEDHTVRWQAAIDGIGSKEPEKTTENKAEAVEEKPAIQSDAARVTNNVDVMPSPQLPEMPTASNIDISEDTGPVVVQKAIVPVSSIYHRHKLLHRKASDFKELSARTRSPVAHIWYENGNGRVKAFGIGDNGELALTELVTDGVYTFVWPFSARKVSIFFYEETSAGKFEFDRPVTIDFNRHVATRMVTTGDVAWGEVYVNNRQQIAGNGNYLLNDADVPPVLNGSDSALAKLPTVPALYVRGDMNQWGTDYPLLASSPNSYSALIPLTDEAYQFKFADESWSSRWNFGGAFNANSGLNRSGGADNLTITLPNKSAGQYAFYVHFFPNRGGFYSFYHVEYHGDLSANSAVKDCYKSGVIYPTAQPGC